ncbi:MAG: hypothetical protein U0795_04335 [Pirellulales bacterium]
MRFSIREILLVVFLIGISFAGLTGGRMANLLALAVLATVVTALLITAIAGRGEYRTFAIGSLIPLCIYSADTHGWTNFHLQELVDEVMLDAYARIPQVQSKDELDLSFPQYRLKTQTPPPNMWGPPARFASLFTALLCVAAGYVSGKFAVWVRAKTG